MYFSQSWKPLFVSAEMKCGILEYIRIYVNKITEVCVWMRCAPESWLQRYQPLVQLPCGVVVYNFSACWLNAKIT